jgi:hypothetical protein
LPPLSSGGANPRSRARDATVVASQLIDVRIHRFQSVSAVTGATVDIVLTFQLVVAIVIALFVAYNVFHYILFLLVTQPKDASKIGHELNQFEQRQLIEWTPQPSDFLKHDDEKRTYDDVFGTYRDEQANYSTCVFPRVAFSRPYEAEYVLLKLKDGMRLLDLGCGSGAGQPTCAKAFLNARCWSGPDPRRALWPAVM